jgi:t-SNARE complex subunit (syntaxin)
MAKNMLGRYVLSFTYLGTLMNLHIEIFSVLLVFLGLIGAMFKFLWTRIDRQFDKIDQRFEKIDQRFEKIDQRFERLEQKLDQRFDGLQAQIAHLDLKVTDLSMRVSITEVRLEERKPQTTWSMLPTPAKRGRKPKQLT